MTWLLLLLSPMWLQPGQHRSLPCVYWPHAVDESVAVVQQAGLDRLCVPPELAERWRAAGIEAVPVSPGDLASREVLPAPGIVHRADLVSATRSPWVVANGWRSLRAPAERFRYELPPGTGALAAAEAFAYGEDALLSIDAADLSEVSAMLAFLREVPAAGADAAVGDVGVVDDGSEEMGEVMNMLSRRNLLFEVVKARDRRFPVTVAFGSRAYSRQEAGDPSALALKVRRRLTDGARTIRVYGSEVVITRVTRRADGMRVQLLNYGGREIEGLRVRLRGTYRGGEAQVSGIGRVPLDELAVVEGGTEFSIPRLTIYASVELTTVR
jgi:hypothetical protein